MSATVGRIRRALSQRMYLVNRSPDLFIVSGSTGKHYHVTIQRRPRRNVTLISCTCPDHEYRGNICKHIIFILIRVLHLPPGDRLIQILDIESDHLEHLIAEYGAPDIRTVDVDDSSTKTIFVDQNPVIAIQKAIQGSCPICFEKMHDTDRIWWCQRRCGNNVHWDCWVKWCEYGNDTCIYCRTSAM